MTQLKSKWKIPLMVFLVLTFFVTGLIPEEKGYKIISYKGTVKVKKDNKIIPLTGSQTFPLKKDHALMLYKDASVEIVFPDGSRETFYGPFFAAVSTLQKPFTKKQLWKPIQRIFEEEGAIHGPTRSGPADRGAFKDEINKRLADKSLDDPTLPADKVKEMNAALETVDTLFNAFPKVRRIVIKALVYREFGLNKKALETIMAYYNSIANKPGKKIVRGQVEDYVYTEFLPITITIEPQSSVGGPVMGFYRTFSANIELWWAAFYYNGKELIEIEKTCDYKQHPQKTFAVRKNLDVIPGQSPHCIFVVVCPEWRELENYDNIRTAKNKLLTKKETKVNTVKDWGKVTIKLCL
ncbi:MAG: hypothetical protein JSV88_13205 [Candidatus Aminicenantes bacterium]|nr:MAG: hypothetical protein JSV88_13205 [Candidatus Aminicenantes bacterium]